MSHSSKSSRKMKHSGAAEQQMRVRWRVERTEADHNWEEQNNERDSVLGVPEAQRPELGWPVVDMGKPSGKRWREDHRSSLFSSFLSDIHTLRSSFTVKYEHQQCRQSHLVDTHRPASGAVSTLIYFYGQTLENLIRLDDLFIYRSIHFFFLCYEIYPLRFGSRVDD